MTTLALSGRAHAAEFFGHWAASSLTKVSAKHFRLNEFQFRVTSRKLEKFLACMKKAHPDSHIFLFGPSNWDDPKKNVVTRAFWCDGEIGLSSCPAGNQRKTCP